MRQRSWTTPGNAGAKVQATPSATAHRMRKVTEGLLDRERCAYGGAGASAFAAPCRRPLTLTGRAHGASLRMAAEAKSAPTGYIAPRRHSFAKMPPIFYLPSNGPKPESHGPHPARGSFLSVWRPARFTAGWGFFAGMPVMKGNGEAAEPTEKLRRYRRAPGHGRRGGSQWSNLH